MTRKRWMIVAAVMAVLGAWYLLRPERRFIDTVVSEGLPEAAAADGPATAQTGAEALPRVLATGRFHAVRHEGGGVATVHAMADGSRVLRFTEFGTDNGPDLYVYLIAASDAHDDETVRRSEFVSLGRLKGNRGDQNYEIPSDVDLATFRAVSIWCRRFGVNFVTAPLDAS
jgi:hypothetical protein